MEINRHQTPKNLHHHALPIVILAIAVLAVSAPYLLHQNTLSGNDGTTLVRDLSTRTLQVNPTTNGFARITVNKNATVHISPEVTQAGRTAELIFTLNNSR
jgi:hypothetical protein